VFVRAFAGSLGAEIVLDADLADAPAPAARSASR
jgi:hypothetical protein